jgi:hypothetical protein
MLKKFGLLKIVAIGASAVVFVVAWATTTINGTRPADVPIADKSLQQVQRAFDDLRHDKFVLQTKLRDAESQNVKLNNLLAKASEKNDSDAVLARQTIALYRGKWLQDRVPQPNPWLFTLLGFGLAGGALIGVRLYQARFIKPGRAPRGPTND